jgi:chemotaxis protein CheX
MTPPLTQDLIADAVIRATSGVFDLMLGLPVNPGKPYSEPRPPSTSNGVVALIGLAGKWTGSGCISCTAETACRVASHFLSQPFESVDDEVLDAVGELANMIIGNVKNDLEDHVGTLGLSMPTVVFGRNFTARSASGTDWVVVPFYIESQVLYVKLCLTSKSPRNAQPVDAASVFLSAQ